MYLLVQVFDETMAFVGDELMRKHLEKYVDGHTHTHLQLHHRRHKAPANNRPQAMLKPGTKSVAVLRRETGSGGGLWPKRRACLCIL